MASPQPPKTIFVPYAVLESAEVVVTQTPATLLPGHRVLVAGTNIVFDSTTPNELVINGSGSTGVPAHAPTHEPGGSDALTVDAVPATGSLRTLGTGPNQAAAGNDARLTNARTPTAHKTTHEPGGSDALTVDAIPATGSLRTLGPGANQAAPGNDARFTDARPPTAHHATHETGGSDAIVALSGAVITTGTVADARLSSNVALKNINNNFSADQQMFKASPVFTFYNTSDPVDQRTFRVFNQSQLLSFQSVNDAITVQQGVISFNRLGSMGLSGSVFERGRAVAMGDLVDVPFNAANFSGTSGGTWTVSSTTAFTYSLVGRTVLMTIVFQGADSVIAGNPVYLNINLPIGPSIRSIGSAASYFVSGSVGPAIALAQMPPGATTLSIIRDVLGSPWGPGNPYIYINLIYFI